MCNIHDSCNKVIIRELQQTKILTGLAAPQCLMLQLVLKAKLTFSHFGQIQSPSDKPSGPAKSILPF